MTPRRMDRSAGETAAGIDVLTARAEVTWKGVPYDPAKFGWEAPD